MSFYRTMLAAVAAIVIASPVFADDTSSTQTTAGTDASQTTQATSTDTANTNQAADQNATSSETKVNLNKATAKELMAVKGVTSSRANAIVKYRKQHGDFKSVEDLANVRGFKKMKTDKLKEITDQLTIE